MTPPASYQAPAPGPGGQVLPDRRTPVTCWPTNCFPVVLPLSGRGGDAIGGASRKTDHGSSASLLDPRASLVQCQGVSAGMPNAPGAKGTAGSPVKPGAVRARRGIPSFRAFGLCSRVIPLPFWPGTALDGPPSGPRREAVRQETRALKRGSLARPPQLFGTRSRGAHHKGERQDAFCKHSHGR